MRVHVSLIKHRDDADNLNSGAAADKKNFLIESDAYWLSNDVIFIIPMWLTPSYFKESTISINASFVGSISKDISAALSEAEAEKQIKEIMKWGYYVI